MDPKQFEMVIVEAGLHGFSGGAAGDRKSKLLIFMGGCNVFVSVCLDAGRHSHKHLRPQSELGAQFAEPFDLVEGVDDDSSDPRVQRLLQFFGALVVSVQTDSSGIHPSAKDHRQLTTSAYVDPQTFFGNPARNRRAEKGLAGVVDVPTVERRREGSGPGTQIYLVDDIDRCADLVRDLAHANSGDHELPVTVLGDSSAPQLGQTTVSCLGRLHLAPQAWQVIEVPAGFTSTTRRPASSALATRICVN